jgi:hypothetical protein
VAICPPFPQQGSAKDAGCGVFAAAPPPHTADATAALYHIQTAPSTLIGLQFQDLKVLGVYMGWTCTTHGSDKNYIDAAEGENVTSQNLDVDGMIIFNNIKK